MIPKIIHQTYKTNYLPEDLKKWHENVKNLHPSWEIKLWTDEDNLQLVKKHFPHLLSAYTGLPYPIMRVDIVRYMYMAVYGGVYLDLDYELFKPIDEITEGKDLLLPLSREKNGRDFYKSDVIIGNCIFASAPGHIFWHDVIQTFAANPPLKQFSNKINILKLTGPEFITRIYFSNPGKYHAHLPKKTVFHPDFSYARRPAYQHTLLNKGSVGLHHCKESWLKENNSIRNLISRVIASLNRRVRSLVRQLTAIEKEIL
jgi:mannosyltransferase OCH1-like enzyme